MKKRKSIAFFSPTLQIGGVEKVFITFANCLVQDFDESEGMSKDNIKTTRLEDLRIWGAENRSYPFLRIRLRIAYWYLMKMLEKCLPVPLNLKWRNYKLERQGYKLEKN